MPTAIRELARNVFKRNLIVFLQFHQLLKMWNNGIFVEKRRRKLYHLIKNENLANVLVFREQNMELTMFKAYVNMILLPKLFMVINLKCKTAGLDGFKIKEVMFL
jgi:hypothetical protein